MKSLKRQGGWFATVTIPALTSAFGAATQYFGQQNTNDQNLGIAMMNNATTERLSSTAHQREVADLTAAGLNPILSANRSGASTPQQNMPIMINPMQNAAHSGADIGRTIAQGYKTDREIKNMEQQYNINKPKETVMGHADAGLGFIKTGITEAVRGTLEAIGMNPIGTMDNLLGGVESTARRVGEMASAVSGKALDAIQGTVRTYGHRMGEAITSPEKYIAQRVNSAQQLANIMDTEPSKRWDTNLQGNPDKIREALRQVKDPAARFKIMEAYERQLRRDGHTSSKGASGKW